MKSVDLSRRTHNLYFPMFRSNYSFVTLIARSILCPQIYCFFWFVFVVFGRILMTVHNSVATVAFQSIVSHGCQRDQLHRCVKTAEPLLRNPDYVVPSTISDVSTHCRSLHWKARIVFHHFWAKQFKSNEILFFLLFTTKELETNSSIASEATHWYVWRAIGVSNNCKSL